MRASLGTRFAAALLDFLILTITVVGAVLLLGVAALAGGMGRLWNGDLHHYNLGQAFFVVAEQAVVFLYPLGYRLWGWRSGATPGMRLLEVRVVDARTGNRLSWSQCALRLCGNWFSWITMGVGFLWAAFRQDRRGWTDLYAGTLVVHRPGAPPQPVWQPSPYWTSPPPPPPPPAAPVANSAAGPAMQARIRVPWRWTDVLPVLIILVPLILGVDHLVAWFSKNWLTSVPTSTRREMEGLLADILYYGSMVAVVLFLAVRRRHAAPEALGLRFPGWQWIGAALPFASLAMVLESMGAVISFALFPGTPNNQCTDIRHEFGGSMLLALVSVALIAPFAEELIFRGFVFSWLASRLHIVSAIVTSAILFSAAHILFAQPTLFLPIFTTGLVLATLYTYARSIWPTFVVHLTFNLLATLVIFSNPGC